MPNTPSNFRASGDIYPGRAVKVSGQHTAAQCGSNQAAVGIARLPSNYAPLSNLISTNKAAVSGEPVSIIGDGEEGFAQAGGSFSAGNKLKSDTDGKLVAVAGAGGAEHVVAMALEDASANNFVRVRVAIEQIYN